LPHPLFRSSDECMNSCKVQGSSKQQHATTCSSKQLAATTALMHHPLQGCTCGNRVSLFWHGDPEHVVESSSSDPSSAPHVHTSHRRSVQVSLQDILQGSLVAIVSGQSRPSNLMCIPCCIPPFVARCCDEALAMQPLFGAFAYSKVATSRYNLKSSAFVIVSFKRTPFT
jgi:hypothetical protein